MGPDGDCSGVDNCFSCGYMDNYCFECEPGWIVENGNCVRECSEGYYHHKKHRTCYSDRCPGDRTYNPERNACICPSGMLYNKERDECTTCQKIHPFCSKCKSGTFICEACLDEEKILSDDGLSCEYPKEIEELNTKCLKEKPGTKICLKCAFPYTLNNNQKCVFCKEEAPNCELCSGYRCIKCAEDHSLNSTSKCHPNNIKKTGNVFFGFFTFTSSIFSQFSLSSAFKLVQSFRFLKMGERRYPLYIQKLIDTLSQPQAAFFGTSLISLPPRDRDLKLDNVSAELYEDFLDSADGDFQTLLILIILGLILAGIHSVFAKDGYINKIYIEQTKKKKNNILEKIFKRNFTNIFSVVFYMSVNFILPSLQNIFYASSNSIGKILGMGVVLFYLGFAQAWILFPNWKIFQGFHDFLRDDLKQTNLIYLFPVNILADFLKCCFGLFFRGFHRGQFLGLIIAHLLPLIYWGSICRFFIFKEKWVSIMIIARESVTILNYFFGLWDKKFTNFMFYVCLILQILIFLVYLIFALVMIVKSFIEAKNLSKISPKKNKEKNLK